MKTNILYFGDNLHVLRERIPAETIDLLYLDPPFNSNRNYFVLFKDRTGKASAAQEEAFADTWTWTEESEATYKEILVSCPNRELATTIQALRTVLRETPMMAYLVAMAIRLVEMHRVLKPTGSLYLHCDPTASHYLKLVLDVIFGPTNFRNEITWKRNSAHNDTAQGLKRYGRNHDIILFYTKSNVAVWNPQYVAYGDEYIRVKYNYTDPDGRRWKSSDLTAPGGASKGNPLYEFMGVTRYWRYSKANMEKLLAEGRVYLPRPGAIPRMKHYLDEMPGIGMQDTWIDIAPINSQAQERLGYPTQKPLALLERIILTSSNPGDVVMDTYCGCGTTVTAAHKLNRRWIGIDITAVAVGVIKSRLEQTFPELKGKVEVEGFPRDFESARTLFEIDPFRFQVWACTLIGAFPLTKKGADAGIDGWLNFLDLDDTPQRAVVQVKGGKVTVGQIRDFCHVVTREKAALGFFLCMGEITRPMREEAVKEGFWTSAGGKDYPHVQILSIADLLAGREAPRYPVQDKASILGFKAAQQHRHGQQAELFGEDA